MKRLKIIIGEDNPILRVRSEAVKNFDKGLQKFVKGMEKAMKKANGLGIAAPQVGENLRVFLTTLNFGKKGNQTLVAMVNPEILEWSSETEVGEEGCLSLPGIYGNVERAKKVKVKFQTVEGLQQVMELEGLDARVVQHELDHLNGVLFIDKLADGKLKEVDLQSKDRGELEAA